jgi:hypothetical protein
MDDDDVIYCIGDQKINQNKKEKRESKDCFG